MRLKRLLPPPRLHKPILCQNPNTVLVPRIHIRHHPLHPSLPKHTVRSQQRGESFGHVALFPVGAVQHEADFGLGGAPDADFADHFVVVVVVAGGVGVCFCWGEEHDDEVEGAVCGRADHFVEVF